MKNIQDETDSKRLEETHISIAPDTCLVPKSMIQFLLLLSSLRFEGKTQMLKKKKRKSPMS